jgi:hypothetical protein
MRGGEWTATFGLDDDMIEMIVDGGDCKKVCWS